MITEDYVSFEVAKLLKEKGFDKFNTYGWDEELFDKEHPRNFSLGFDSKEHWISAPTHQMAMKWLREVHHIFIRIIQSHLEYCSCEIYYDRVRCHNFMESFDSYEQAVETALKFSLENLI